MKDRKQFAKNLLGAARSKRKSLLSKYLTFCDAELARAFQEICYEVWTAQPQKVSLIVEILNDVIAITDDPEIRAYAEWTDAIKHLVNGELESCVRLLNTSELSFKELGKTHAAATTQTSKLYALALLGRYDEAVDCGLRARDVFLSENDIYSTGKIEHNIGNLFWRRDKYRESEPFLESAHRRFLEKPEHRPTSMGENSQAFVKALQNNFLEAEKIYEISLNRAKQNELTVTRAEIEIGLSNLYLYQGKFDLALNFMENSRRTYDSLNMPHQSVNCELEIADIYLELNLLPEALNFYRQTDEKFSRLGMRAELARSLLNHAKALYLSDELSTAAKLLKKAQTIYENEGNLTGAAAVKLTNVQILSKAGNFDAAEEELAKAVREFKKTGNDRHQLFSQWLSGDLNYKQNRFEKAKSILRQTLTKSKGKSRQIEYLSLISLGKLTNDESYFLEAVEIVEKSRTSLASEEFRTSYFADKLTAFNELTKLRLNQGEMRSAFAWHERSRSRSLSDSRAISDFDTVNDPHINALRDELNWHYSRINRSSASGLKAREEVSKIRKHAEKLEKKLSEKVRRFNSTRKTQSIENRDLDIDALQKQLGETVLLEFASLGGKLFCFVVSGDLFECFEYSFGDEKIREVITQFLFQIKTARIFGALSDVSRERAFSRMITHSKNLYDLLLRPLEMFIRSKDIKIVPFGALNYLPFQALHDGDRFVIERSEISFAPSAAVFCDCANREPAKFKNALLVGVEDRSTPFVRKEIAELGNYFESSVKLFGKNATRKNIAENLNEADIVHLACHGNFRPDNPEFSSIALFSENLTANQLRAMNFKNKFVALSACETGLNKVVEGEELIGLTSGFLAAGANSLLLSLWTVNDEFTNDLMKYFYREAISGQSAEKALQTAQIQTLTRNSHPYFWAPFIIMGK